MLGGLFVVGLSIVLLDNGLFHLVRTGSCGSGGSGSSFVSYKPCPPGTGGHILSLRGGIFGCFIGFGLYAARGRTTGVSSTIGLGLLIWSLLFVTIAGSIAYAAYGPGNTDSSGAKTTAIILGVIFVPMGLAPLLLALGGRRKAANIVQLSTTGFNPSTVATFTTTPYTRPPTGPPTPRPAPTPAKPEDPLEKIARLGQLRDRGLLTPEEFEAQKKRLLGEI
jgi:hypothetical protein